MAGNESSAARKPRGRPKSTGGGMGSEKRKATHTLGIRLTPDEKKLIETKAREAGLTAGSFMRQASLGVQIKSNFDNALIHEVATLHRELRKLGGLQVTLSKKIPQRAEDYTQVWKELQKLAKSVFDVLARITK